MEDIRKLLNDHDAQIAPESLAHIWRGAERGDHRPARRLPARRLPAGRPGRTPPVTGNQWRPHPLRRALLCGAGWMRSPRHGEDPRAHEYSLMREE